MEKFYRASRAIILFLIIMLVIETAFSDKTAQKTAILILMSMLILNSQTIADWLSSATSVFDVTTTSTTDPNQSSVHTDENGVEHGGAGKGF